jgi:hypothetical protein
MFPCASSKELPIGFSAAHAQAAVNLFLACVDLGEAAGHLVYAWRFEFLAAVLNPTTSIWKPLD